MNPMEKIQYTVGTIATTNYPRLDSLKRVRRMVSLYSSHLSPKVAQLRATRNLLNP